MRYAAPMFTHSPDDESRLAVLDGWRGISVLLVLATHLLPLGPKAWRLNETAGPMGMALFFTLSGFLITRFLIDRPNILEFLTRRFFRIIPLAWLSMIAALVMADAPTSAYLPHFFFYANLPPQHLTEIGSHLWSLCVEMQFYVGIALLVGLLGRRGLYLLPVFCVAVTIHRIMTDSPVDIVTWRRVDEILAGAMLAMAYMGRFGPKPLKLVSKLNVYALIVLLAVSSHPEIEFMNYVRPYIAALLVGVTLAGSPTHLNVLLKGRVLRYIAAVSYALYVIHHVLIYTWLGSGDKFVKYMKRPLLFAATFALAHVSSFYFERPCVAFGKRLSTRFGHIGIARTGR